MSVTISRSDWDNDALRESALRLAEALGEDLEVVYEREAIKPYNVRLWLHDDVMASEDFDRKSDALAWSRNALSEAADPECVADVRKFNSTGDDFDWWFYRLVDGRLKQVYDF